MEESTFVTVGAGNYPRARAKLIELHPNCEFEYWSQRVINGEELWTFRINKEKD